MQGRVRREHGKGVIGFIVALVVVMFGGNALFQAFKVKNRADVMQDFVRKALGEAQQMKWDTDKLRMEIVKKAKEIGAPIPAGEKLEVQVDDARWWVHFEWDDTMTIPGYTHTWHFVVDETWKRF